MNAEVQHYPYVLTKKTFNVETSFKMSLEPTIIEKVVKHQFLDSSGQLKIWLLTNFKSEVPSWDSNPNFGLGVFFRI